jgi:hypothetical protein
VSLYADSEPITISSVDWVPTAPRTRTTAVLCVTAGTLYVDFLGVQPGQIGNTNQPIPFAVNQIIEMAIVKAHHASSTGTYAALY